MTDDPITRILSYLYNNQDFNIIKGDLNEQNVSVIYSQAYVMKMEKLKSDLEEYIASEILKPANCTQFYLEAIRFKDDRLSKAAQELIVKYFHEI